MQENVKLKHGHSAGNDVLSVLELIWISVVQYYMYTLLPFPWEKLSLGEYRLEIWETMHKS